MLPSPPPLLRARDALPFGRYAGPIRTIEPPKGLFALRVKRWHYVSVTHAQWFFALGLVQLGYASQGFAYFVDRRTLRRYAFERVLPGSFGVSIAQSSTAGVSTLDLPFARVRIAGGSAISVQGSLLLDHVQLSLDLALAPDQSLGLVHALGPERFAYTHKSAAMRVHGTMRLGSVELPLDDALAAMDFTVSEARHHTRWRWASVSGRARSGRRFGLNLSELVYGAEENVWFDDGVLHPLGPVSFTVPKRALEQRWQIVGDEVELEVEPLGARTHTTKLGPLQSRFVQAYGHVRGRVADAELRDQWAIVEDHDAHW